MNFSDDENTFEKTHARLIAEIELLFSDKLDQILSLRFEPKIQRGRGSYHSAADLPKSFPGWQANIPDTIEILEKDLGAVSKGKLELIDQIEKIRTSNNVNWMDLLRLAFKAAPREAKDLIRRINLDDNKISELFKKLGE